MWERLIEISPEQGVESDRQTVATGWDDGQTISGPWSDAPPSTPAVPVAKAPEMPWPWRRSRRRRRSPRRSRTPDIDAELASITDDESPLTSSGLPRRRAADKPANGELPTADLLSSPLDMPAPSPLPRRNASGARSFSTSSAFGRRPVVGPGIESFAEEIRSLLSSYRSGLTQGRLSDALKSRTNGSANGAENGEQS